MLLSIIIPVYNTEKYVKQCLESVINQTFSDFELIIVNDGSTDSSLEICKQYEQKDKRVKLISQDNGGIVKAVRTGVMHASGKYISFVDSDDFCDLNKYEVLMEKAVSYDCDMVACGIKSEENIRPCLAKPGYYDYDSIKKYIYKSCFLFGGYCCRYNKIIKRSVLLKDFDLYQNISQSNEDYIFFTSFFFNVKSLYICDDILCNVRTITNQNSTTKRNRINLVGELNPLYDYFKKIYVTFNKSKFLSQTHNLFFNSLKTSIVSASRNMPRDEAIKYIKDICKMKLTKIVCKKLSWRHYPSKHYKDKLLALIIRLRFARIIYYLGR